MFVHMLGTFIYLQFMDLYYLPIAKYPHPIELIVPEKLVLYGSQSLTFYLINFIVDRYKIYHYGIAVRFNNTGWFFVPVRSIRSFNISTRVSLRKEEDYFIDRIYLHTYIVNANMCIMKYCVRIFKLLIPYILQGKQQNYSLNGTFFYFFLRKHE